MNKSSTTLLAASLSAAVTLAAVQAAQAQTPSESAQQVQSRTDERITSLHAQLEITKAQEPAWQAFTSVMKQNAQDMTASLAARQKNFAGMNAVQNLQDYADMSMQQAQHLSKLVAPFQALYAQLSPTQKATADRIFHNYADRGPHVRG